MSAPSDRRGFLRGLVSLPLIGGGAAFASTPSDLASTCEWAIRHNAWISATAMSDDEVSRQVDRHEAAIIRAIEEPSRSVADLGAKARMLLDDIEGKELLRSPYSDDRLIVVVLREAAGFVEGGR